MQAIDDLEQQIVDALRAVVDQNIQITQDTDISRDLGLDSLTIMNFMMKLEDTFDLSIPLERLPEIQTVGDLADIIRDIRAKV